MNTKFKTINGYTKQSMIDIIMKKNNGKRSLSNNGAVCAYRGQENNCCAVGAFILDELYTKEMEAIYNESYVYSGGADDLLRFFPQIKPYMPLNSYGLCEMQDVHDKAKEEDGDVRDLLINWVNEHVID